MGGKVYLICKGKTLWTLSTNFLYSSKSLTQAKKCLLFCLVPTPAQESRIEELESDLKDKDEEIKSLKEQSSQIKPVNG